MIVEVKRNESWTGIAQIIKAKYRVKESVMLDCPITLLVCQKCENEK